MTININTLDEIYRKSIDNPENKSWIAIPDSKEGTLHVKVIGSSGGKTDNGWKIHVSVDPNKISQAAQLIAQELNNEKAPRVSIKFAGKQLANTGQPSKQVAFIFYAEELKNKEKIAAFLNNIETLLRVNDIGVDPRPINSDIEAIRTKYDAILFDTNGEPTRFNYRNEGCIVMEDKLYYEVRGVGDTFVQGQQIWVKQSYYIQLENSQKHNPGNRVEDPLKEIRINPSNIEWHEFVDNPIHFIDDSDGEEDYIDISFLKVTSVKLPEDLNELSKPVVSIPLEVFKNNSSFSKVPPPDLKGYTQDLEKNEETPKKFNSEVNPANPYRKVIKGLKTYTDKEKKPKTYWTFFGLFKNRLAHHYKNVAIAQKLLEALNVEDPSVDLAIVSKSKVLELDANQGHKIHGSLNGFFKKAERCYWKDYYAKHPDEKPGILKSISSCFK